jgi:hypothetical protein
MMSSTSLLFLTQAVMDPVISIDYHANAICAVRTVVGAPEERQSLEAGPNGMGVCTWSNGLVFGSDVPNLTIASRAAAAIAIAKAKAATKKKPAAAPKKKQEMNPPAASLAKMLLLKRRSLLQVMCSKRTQAIQ